MLASGLLSPFGASSLTEWLFDAIIAPGQATLFALLAFFMIAAAYRLLRGPQRRRLDATGALLMLTAQAPAAGVWMSPGLTRFAGWTLDVPVMATLRRLWAAASP